MEPLDLTAHPPRNPRLELAGVMFLPRTIDKARASLHGGKLGVYRMPGLSVMLLERLGVPLDDFIAEVGRAANDDEVGAYVRSRTTDDRIAQWTEFLAGRRPFGGDRAAAKEEYPWLGDDGELPLSLDVLVEDDRQRFAQQ